MNFKKINFLLLAVMFVSLSSCNKDEMDQIHEEPTSAKNK